MVSTVSASLYVIRDAHGPSESTICRTVKRVVTAINASLFDEIIQWPERPHTLADDFFLLGGMPCVCGVVDGTLVPITAPSNHEHQFVDRHKKGHSINVMAVAGPNMKFYYVSAKWPGSVNDARVLRNSSLNNAFQNGFRPFHGAVILGDSIYPTKNWLIPPQPAPHGGAEERFNRAHKKTRAVIERAFGVMKARFPILRHIRVLEASYAAEIIKTVCVLHNLCLQFEQHRYNDLNEAEYNAPRPEIIEVDHDIRVLAGDGRNERKMQLIIFFA